MPTEGAVALSRFRDFFSEEAPARFVEEALEDDIGEACCLLSIGLFRSSVAVGEVSSWGEKNTGTLKERELFLTCRGSTTELGDFPDLAVESEAFSCLLSCTAAAFVSSFSSVFGVSLSGEKITGALETRGLFRIKSDSWKDEVRFVLDVFVSFTDFEFAGRLDETSDSVLVLSFDFELSSPALGEVSLSGEKISGALDARELFRTA